MSSTKVRSGVKPRPCVVCGAEFLPKQERSRVCGNKGCQRRHSYQKNDGGKKAYERKKLRMIAMYGDRARPMLEAGKTLADISAEFGIHRKDASALALALGVGSKKRFDLHIKIPCIKCLRLCGVGGKRIARVLRIGVNDANRAVRELGLVGAPVLFAFKASPLPSPVELITQEYESEVKLIAQFEDQPLRFYFSKERSRQKARAYYHSLPKHERRQLWYRHREMLRANPERMARKRQYTQAWKRQRYAESPVYRAVASMRTRISAILRKGGNESRTIEEMVGCSLAQLKRHLESQFKTGMSWSNYGAKWHVDHFAPVAAFDCSNEAQLRRCFHYTNLRPLWAKANVRRGAPKGSFQLAML